MQVMGRTGLCHLEESILTTHLYCTSLQKDIQYLACLAPSQELERGSETGSSVFGTAALHYAASSCKNGSRVQLRNEGWNAINFLSAGNKWPLI